MEFFLFFGWKKKNIFWTENKKKKIFRVLRASRCRQDFVRLSETPPTAKLHPSTATRFELARAKPSRFLVYRLNHSATLSEM